ncbi:GntR family transcriptional regulator [Streptomyces sp. NPDC001663]|uniref:GntR family transcriptional regulator n=1 Tax=Streptomyces sp. NPDC001663 TaxID=3364597 RepID=UPI0036A4CB46
MTSEFQDREGQARRAFEAIRRPTRPSVERGSMSKRVGRLYDLIRTRYALSGDDDLKIAEQAIVDASGASRNAVRAALSLLADEGLIARQTRTGTRPVPLARIAVDEWQELGAYDPNEPDRVGYIAVGHETEEANPLLAEVTDVPVGTPTLVVESLLWHRGRRIGLLTSYLPRPSGIDSGGTIHDITALLRAAGPLSPSQTLTGASAAEDRAASLLGVPPGSPLAWVQDQIRSTSGEFVALNYVRVRPDRAIFELTLKNSFGSDS